MPATFRLKGKEIGGAEGGGGREETQTPSSRQKVIKLGVEVYLNQNITAFITCKGAQGPVPLLHKASGLLGDKNCQSLYEHMLLSFFFFLLLFFCWVCGGPLWSLRVRNPNLDSDPQPPPDESGVLAFSQATSS